MSKKCPECGKTVYFAERSEYEGQWFHTVCLGEKQKREQATPSARAFSQWSGKRDPYAAPTSSSNK